MTEATEELWRKRPCKHGQSGSHYLCDPHPHSHVFPHCGWCPGGSMERLEVPSSDGWAIEIQSVCSHGMWDCGEWVFDGDDDVVGAPCPGGVVRQYPPGTYRLVPAERGE